MLSQSRRFTLVLMRAVDRLLHPPQLVVGVADERASLDGAATLKAVWQE